MVKPGWPKSQTKIEIGAITKNAPSISPFILSVSRSTDIPAFYSDWFIERLKEGYAVWLNPINRKPQIINFENVKFIVFWTKNDIPLRKHLKYIDDVNIRYYFQYSINDYEKEALEPNVPPLSVRINSFKELSSKIGKDKVIWRFDPLLLSKRITIDTLTSKIQKVGNLIHPFTEKLVISFIDIEPYRAVRRNLDNFHHKDVREFTQDEMLIFAEKLENINRCWGLQIATCGEMIDLSEFGIEHNRCIDPELMKRICNNDSDFRRYISEHSEKDKGQREVCGCMASKDIGMYNTCMHQCVYCYANHFSQTVINNYQKHLESKHSAIINGSCNWEEEFIETKSSQISLDKF
jgi:DNA repair photolyase